MLFTVYNSGIHSSVEQFKSKLEGSKINSKKKDAKVKKKLKYNFIAV